MWLTTSTSDVLIGQGRGDVFSGTSATDNDTDIVVDATTGDSDVFNLAVTADPAAMTVLNVETINITSSIVGGTALTVNADNFRGVDTVNVTRAAVGSISGTGAVTVQDIVGGRVSVVNAVSGVNALTVEQQTLDGITVNATGVTGAVTLSGAGTIVANSSTGTITLDDEDIGNAALAATGLDGATVITAALATSIQVGQGTGTLTGAVTINAAAATDIDVTTTGAVSITTGSAAIASSTITVNDVDASGATIISGLTGTTTITSTIELEGAGATDVATVSAKGAVSLDIDGGAGNDVDTLNLSGNGAAVTYTFEAGNDFSTINLTGSQSVTLVGAIDDFDGETVADATTAGTTTLRFNAATAATAIDLGDVSVDVIDIDIANYAAGAGTPITLANNQTVLVSEDQGTDDLTLTADDEGFAITVNAGDDTADTSLATITLGAAVLTDFDTVTINATSGALSATSVDFSSTSSTVAVSIRGNKAVTLGDVLAAGEIATIDASALTGVFTAELQDGDLTSLSTGSAADVIEINAATLAATINAGDGANNIDIDAAADGLIVTTGSGADNVEIVDADSFVISTGAGNDTVVITGNIDTDAVIDAGDGTADTLDINTATSVDLSDSATNPNFSFVNFEIVDIAGADGTITIAAADFANENSFELVGAGGDDVLRVTGTATANTINATGVSIDTATLQINGGDGADTLIGSDDGTTFVITAVAHVDAGEIITGGTGTDAIVYDGAAGSLDLSVATITGVESLDTEDVTSVILAQGTGITTISGIAATETLTLKYLTTVFEVAGEAGAGDVNIAGEWNLADTGADAVLTYFDQSLSLVVAVTLTGQDASTAVVVSGNLFVTYAT